VSQQLTSNYTGMLARSTVRRGISLTHLGILDFIELNWLPKFRWG